MSAGKKGTLRFGFVEDMGDEASWGPLVDILTTYIDGYKQLGKDTSLIVFFRPHDETHAITHYRERFWSVLRYLHERDPEPWPAEVPRDGDDPWWEFSFAGCPLFVVCNTPAHRQRRSRHSPGMLITFQPRWVFEGLEADSPRGAASRRVIRKRLGWFDDVEPSPVLGSYGDADNREWKQYFLPDTNADEGGRCPFQQGIGLERS
nr:hypothetical protein [Kibdelosporangium sp. MJ126-NF4]